MAKKSKSKKHDEVADDSALSERLPGGVYCRDKRFVPPEHIEHSLIDACVNRFFMMLKSALNDSERYQNWAGFNFPPSALEELACDFWRYSEADLEQFREEKSWRGAMAHFYQIGWYAAWLCLGSRGAKDAFEWFYHQTFDRRCDDHKNSRTLTKAEHSIFLEALRTKMKKEFERVCD